MNTDQLNRLLVQLDANVAGFQRLDTAYAGSGPLTFLAPEVRTALNNRLDRVSVNLNRLVVDAVAERLRVTGFTGTTDDAGLWADWRANDLDQLAPACHREALILGTGYTIVWARDDGSPLVSVESARQVTTLIDPGTRQVVAALKRWQTKTTTEAVLSTDHITRLRANHTGATTAGFETIGTLANPLGTVPVVPFRNTARVLDTGSSEMSDVLPLTDAITKLSTDLLTSSEYGARPRRWASGVELIEEPVLDDQGNPTGETQAASPFGDDDRMMLSEAPEAKFGQLPGSDLAGYESAIGVLFRQVSAVTGLPEHMLGIGGDNPTSADAIRASEAALTSKAETKQAIFGRAWETTAQLMAAVRHGVDPATIHPTVTWADPATRSAAQEADAIVKLHTAGILTTPEARQRLGFSATDTTAAGQGAAQ